MANVKITDLTNLPVITSDDLFPVVNNPGGTPATQKATAQTVLNYVTGSTFNSLTVSALSVTNTNSTNGLFTTITGSTITGSTALFTTITGSTITGSTITGSTVTGSTALFTTITGSTVTGSTALFTTITSSTALFTTITSSTALFNGDIRVLGTASISQLNTVNQTSLLIGDKYITILSGGVDHTGINGAGLLWGTSSGPGETTGALGEHAHILYNASRDALQIFPGLYVSGTTVLDGDLAVSSNSGSLNLRRSAALNTIEAHIRPEAGKKGYLSFTENAVADRWIVGIDNGDDALLFKAGSVVTNTERMRITGDGRVGIGTNSPQASSKLHVSGGNSDVRLRIDTSGSDPLLTWTTIAQQDWSAGLDFSDSGKFKIQNSLTAGTLTRLTIDTTGRVGIGTENPTAGLHVVSSNNLTTLDSGKFLTISNTDNTPSARHGIALTCGGESTSGVIITARNNASNGAADLIFQSRTNVGTLEDKFIILANGGNVGIGTISPQVKTEIVKGTQITSRSVANTVLMVSDNSTNTTYLEVANTSSGQAGLLFGKNSNVGGYGLVNYINSADRMELFASGARNFTVDSAGSVAVRPLVQLSPPIGKYWTKLLTTDTSLTQNMGGALTITGTVGSTTSGMNAVDYTTNAADINAEAGIRDANHSLFTYGDPVFSVIFNLSTVDANSKFVTGLSNTTPFGYGSGTQAAFLRYDVGSGDARFRMLINRTVSTYEAAELVTVVPTANTIYRFMMRFMNGGTRMQAWLQVGSGEPILFADTTSAELPTTTTALSPYCQFKNATAVARTLRIQSMFLGVS